MTGHNLKGKNFIRAPVNRDRRAMTTRADELVAKTIRAVELSRSPKKVTSRTSTPMKIRARPSVIHSMRMILRLSVEMSPKPFITEAVGNRWEIPQSKTEKPPIESKIVFNIRLRLLFLPQQLLHGFEIIQFGLDMVQAVGHPLHPYQQDMVQLQIVFHQSHGFDQQQLDRVGD